MKLRVAGIVPESTVDGPGIRLALFVQGCSHRCPGCHNPASQDPAGGVEVSLDAVMKQVAVARFVDGVSFSGGEPFEQPAPLARLAAGIHSRNLDLVLYSGYTFEELVHMGRRDHDVRTLLEYGTLLIDGPYLEAERDLTIPFRGSRNQRILDLPESLRFGQPVEWERQNTECKT